jgi:hypothetical protein
VRVSYLDENTNRMVYLESGANTISQTGLTYRIGGLTNGVDYTFEVNANDICGPSQYIKETIRAGCEPYMCDAQTPFQTSN